LADYLEFQLERVLVLATNYQAIGVASYDLLPVAEQAALPSEADPERAPRQLSAKTRNKSLRESGGSSTSSLSSGLVPIPTIGRYWCPSRSARRMFMGCGSWARRCVWRS
jgi:hypothetical protein